MIELLFARFAERPLAGIARREPAGLRAVPTRSAGLLQARRHFRRLCSKMSALAPRCNACSASYRRSRRSNGFAKMASGIGLPESLTCEAIDDPDCKPEAWRPHPDRGHAGDGCRWRTWLPGFLPSEPLVEALTAFDEGQASPPGIFYLTVLWANGAAGRRLGQPRLSPGPPA